MRRNIWIVPIESYMAWHAVQALSIFMFFMVLQAMSHYQPAHDPDGYGAWEAVAVGAPGAFFLSRLIVRAVRMFVRAVSWIRR